MSTQDNLDAAAAAAFLKHFMAQQQQQPTAAAALPPPPQAPAPAAFLEQLLLATQQQQQQQLPAAQPPALDPNMAQLLAQAINMASPQQQPQSGAPAPLPSQPSFHSMPSMASSSTTTPQEQQQSLMSSVQLLGSLNPSVAAALMSNALKQSSVPPVPAAPAVTVQRQPLPVPSLPASWSNGVPFQQRPPPPPPPSHPVIEMQRWSLEQLESHVQQLKEGGHPIPQAVAILLADAQRKEQKREAKRIANRKSACTSRARKKAKIDQLVNENAHLRRLETILSYLPDPVIVVSPQGVITFCNTQVERVLRHKIDDLVGAKIEDVLVPKSRRVMKKLVHDLLAVEQELSEESNAIPVKKRVKRNNGEGSGNSDGNIISSNTSEPPLLEVKLNATDFDAAGEDVSDSDENPRLSSLTHKNSSFNSNEGDDATPDDSAEKEKRDADANLSKNVEACKLNKDKAKTEQVRFAHKDDVMGASVTANNADAKLSSLMHEPSLKTKHVMAPKPSSDKQEEQSSSTMVSSISKTSSDKPQAKEGNTSEDSGYREESGESPEDSNSSSSSGGSADQVSKQMMRHRPIAPSRNACLIRSDLSTIWCELTSSIRTSIVQESQDSMTKEGSTENESEMLETELLLCFRPIQEGEPVSSDMRFAPVAARGVTDSSGDATSSNNPASTETQLDVNETVPIKKNKPPKKRTFQDEECGELRGMKKSRTANEETSAVESMMELAKKAAHQ
jgi:PAS domain S-box-containing protein